MKDTNDQIYIEKTLAGDIQAFSVIVSRYQNKVFNIVFRIIGNREDAEDLTQEIFLKVYKSLEKFKKESKFSTWIYRIAYNMTLSELRRRKMNFFSIDIIQLDESEDIDNSFDDKIKEEKLNYLNQALKTLVPEELFLISLYYIEGKNIEDIALVSGNSVANIKVKLFRIRKKLVVEINKMNKYE